MNDTQLADLKQFITVSVSQQTADIRQDIKILEKRLDERIDQKLDNLEKRLTAKIDDLSASVAEALEITNEVTSSQLKDHERRIVRLESRTT